MPVEVPVLVQVPCVTESVWKEGIEPCPEREYVM